MTLAEVHVKWSVILMISWVPTSLRRYEWKDKFCVVSERIWKFQVGHWFEMNFGPKSCLCFWSRLNEISRGYQKIITVSVSFWSNLKFLGMIDRVSVEWNDRNRRASLIEKLAHASDFFGKLESSLHKRRSLHRPEFSDISGTFIETLALNLNAN